MWAEFLLTSLIVVLLPGTGVIYTIGIGLTRGPLASIAATAGCTMGILPHMAAAIFGVAALLHTSALVFNAFKIAGLVYLLYLAWSILQAQGPLQIAAQPEEKPLGRVALTGFLINILNPKLSIFFLAFLPQFVPAGETGALILMIVLSAIFMGITFVVFIGYGVFAARIRSHVTSRPNVMAWIRRGFAAAFAAFGARLMLDSA